MPRATASVRVVALGIAIAALVAAAPTIGAPVRGVRAAAWPFRSISIGTTDLLTSNTFNPMRAVLNFDYVIVYNVYSTLLTYDPSHATRGDLAYNWSLSTDGLTWTFHLVHGAVFLDPSNPGDLSHALTAADVAYTYNLQRSTNFSVYHPYFAGVASVTALDSYTVQVVTATPRATVLAAAGHVPILPAYVWSSQTNPFGYNPPYPIGSGPLYYDAANSSTGTVVFRRNPAFYGDAYYCEQVRPDEVRFVAATTGSALVSAFTAGGALNAIDFIDPVSYTTTLASWSPKWGVNEGEVNEFAVNVLTPAIRAENAGALTGTNNPLLLNATVREAIAMSVNKSALVRDGVLGTADVADTLVPETNPWHEAIPASAAYPFNPAAARALLNAAGWAYNATGVPDPGATPLYEAGGTNPLRFRFNIAQGSVYLAEANDLVVWLAQAGIQTTQSNGLTNPGYSVGVGVVTSGNYDLLLWQWLFSPDADPSLEILLLETSMAIPGLSDNFYSNATYDALYNASLAATDPAVRAADVDAMQSLIYDYHSYILPFYGWDLYAATSAAAGTTGTAWTDWGNWSLFPGLSPEGQLPNLWYRIAPSDNLPPVVTSFPSVRAVNGTPAILSVSATDPEHDIVNYTWSFGDGTTGVTTTPSADHVYAAPGTYAVSVRVTDGEWSSCASTTASVWPPGTNTAPTIGGLSYALSNGTYQLAGQPLAFDLTVSDADGDPLFVTWSFGDGTSATSYAASSTQTPRTVQQVHTFSAAGTYDVVVTASDNLTGVAGHSPQTTASIVVRTPAVGGTPPSGGPSGLLAGVPILDWIAVVVVVAGVALAALVFLQVRRKRRQPDRPVEGEPPGRAP